ncbi:MAG: chemotaxis protein [Desulfovibrio sp.]|jgi:two-component system chemotaxis response regulator CheV|nr:chemotaxis protein [Desulfovibrio sp.]
MTQNSLLNINSNELEIVEFLIEEKQPDGTVYSGHYGINVAKVLEIIRLPVITSVPSKHDSSVLGTFNLRGKVLPLLDLAAWLGKEIASTENAKVLVTEFSGVRAAFLVSAVHRIHRLTWDDIKSPNKYVQMYSCGSITGVLRIEDRVLFILDMEKILAGMDSSLDMSQLEIDTSPVEDAEHFHLLVADDSASLRHIIKSALEKSGFRVTAASSGKEAWQYLKAELDKARGEGKDITDNVHLVISDIEMPEMDGHELTEKIRAEAGLAHLPVILFSSLITDAVLARGVKVGADRQVSKPDLPGLNNIIRELIAEKLRK